jgi:hypothetical protein
MEDYKLTPLILTYNAKAETKIRKIETSSETKYVFLIEIGDAVSGRTLTASLTKDEIAEIKAALKRLLEQRQVDAASKADVIENSYILGDGFSIGYVLLKNEATWFLSQKDGIQEKTSFVKDLNAIVKSFSEAEIIMEQLEAEDSGAE